MKFSTKRFQQLAGLLTEERNMYGEIIDPVYYIEVWPRNGLQYDIGPFETEREAEQEILDQVGSRESYIGDEAKLIPQNNRTWYYEDYGADYSIVERERDEL